MVKVLRKFYSLNDKKFLIEDNCSPHTRYSPFCPIGLWMCDCPGSEESGVKSWPGIWDLRSETAPQSAGCWHHLTTTGLTSL